MEPSQPQVFTGITPDQFGRMAEKAREAGIDLNGNSGTASKFGVEIAWDYQPEKQELTIQTLKAPFFLSAADLDARIRSMVETSRG